MPLTTENLPEFLQIIGDPQVQERLANALADRAAPPPIAQAPVQPQQEPQPQAPAAVVTPQQAPPANVAPPNLGMAITGNNPVVQPDIQLG